MPSASLALDGLFLILHSIPYCQLFCRESVKPDATSRECYLVFDTFPVVSYFVRLFDFFCFFFFYYFFFLLDEVASVDAWPRSVLVYSESW